MSVRTSGSLLLLGLALAGCGLKGPLFLPEKSGEVVIRPGPAAAPPATPAEPAESTEPEASTTPLDPSPPEPQPPQPPQPQTGTERG